MQVPKTLHLFIQTRMTFSKLLELTQNVCSCIVGSKVASVITDSVVLIPMPLKVVLVWTEARATRMTLLMA
jgi:hypothetical protein